MPIEQIQIRYYEGENPILKTIYCSLNDYEKVVSEIKEKFRFSDSFQGFFVEQNY